MKDRKEYYKFQVDDLEKKIVDMKVKHKNEKYQLEQKIEELM